MDDAPRKTTWLELFFDLIFVVAITKTTDVLGEAHGGHIAAMMYLKFVLIIVPVWWAWTGYTLFTNRFETTDSVQRVLTLIQMVCAISLSVFINPDFDPNYKGFLLSYVAFRGVLVLMYLRAAHLCPENRAVSLYLGIGFAIGVAISLSSLLFDNDWKYVVLYAGIAFDLAVPLLGRARLKNMPVESHHLPERYALFAIIVLGESVVNLSMSLNAANWNLDQLLAGGAGFVMIAALWWVYFDIIEEIVTGKKLGAGHTIIYGHLFVYAGMSILANVIGFGIHPEIALADHRLLAALALACILVPVSIFQHVYAEQEELWRVFLEGLAVAIVAAVALFLANSALLIVVAMSGAFIVYAVLGVMRVRRA